VAGDENREVYDFLSSVSNRYGLGFWVNEHGRQWPELPRDSFAAWGAGAKHIWVSPSTDLVVVLNPGPWTQVHQERARLKLEQVTISKIVDAVVG